MDKLSGYDANSDTYCNMFELGIVDLTKVVRSALQYAASDRRQNITNQNNPKWIN